MVIGKPYTVVEFRETSHPVVPGKSPKVMERRTMHNPPRVGEHVVLGPLGYSVVAVAWEIDGSTEIMLVFIRRVNEILLPPGDGAINFRKADDGR